MTFLMALYVKAVHLVKGLNKMTKEQLYLILLYIKQILRIIALKPDTRFEVFNVGHVFYLSANLHDESPKLIEYMETLIEGTKTSSIASITRRTNDVYINTYHSLDVNSALTPFQERTINTNINDFSRFDFYGSLQEQFLPPQQSTPTRSVTTANANNSSTLYVNYEER